jgi:NADH:ubiquinone oxidoreductase subunit F (NADH-binding)
MLAPPGGHAPWAAATPMPLAGLLEVADAMDLRGRGGAGFRFATKLSAVRDAADRTHQAPVAVLNGEEGEPASVKDRTLMCLSPHLALDGLDLVTQALGAQRSYAYVSDALARRRLEEAQQHRSSAFPAVTFAAPAGYVSGEESAVVRALSGHPAKPTNKPPRPFEIGVDGRPTLVANVETLAQLARAVRSLAGGAELPEPTVLLTVSNDRGSHTVAEVPYQVTLRDVLAWLAQEPVAGDAVLLGGFFGSFVPPHGLDYSLADLAARRDGLGLGCGVVIVLRDTCPVSAVCEVLHYLDHENAKQCGPCFKGIPSMATVVDALTRCEADADDLERLAGWTSKLRGRGACGTLDAACQLTASLLQRYDGLVAEHMASSCASCAERSHRVPNTSFAVPWPARIEEDS